MFNVGDKVFYPMHGACVIEAIEEKEILGHKQHYYVTRINNMQIMFPMKSDIGIRQVVTQDILEDVLKIFSKKSSDPILKQGLRYHHNMNKLKSGDIYKEAEVIRELVQIRTKKALPQGERTMLDNAMQIFTSELSLIKGIDQEEADDFLYGIINN